MSADGWHAPKRVEQRGLLRQLQLHYVTSVRAAPVTGLGTSGAWCTTSGAWCTTALADAKEAGNGFATPHRGQDGLVAWQRLSNVAMRSQAGHGGPPSPLLKVERESKIMPEQTPTVVPVHGVFAESASWNGVISRLQRRPLRHRSSTPPSLLLGRPRGDVSGCN
jgi:hypothetical protein